MKLRSDGVVRLCAVGLTLAALAMATPVWASVPPASQSESTQSGKIFGIAPGSWLGVFWDTLRAVVGEGEGTQNDPDVPPTQSIDQDEPLTSVPQDSNETELGPGIEPDG